MGLGTHLPSRSRPRDGRAQQGCDGGGTVRESRKQMAERLLELARDCDVAAKENRRAGNAVRRQGGSSGGGNSQASESEGETSAQQWIVKEKSSIRFADVAGLEDVKEDIRLKMIYPFEHPELAEKFGIKPGGGVLMYGPPGTGKTMLAKAKSSPGKSKQRFSASPR